MSNRLDAQPGQLLGSGECPRHHGGERDQSAVAALAQHAEILREEIFGPVAPIVSFSDEADAIRQANATEYGLVAYVYTGDLSRGLRVSEALESGMVGLNRGLVSDPAAPFGGSSRAGSGVRAATTA